MAQDSQKTDFGYKSVDKADKAELVAGVFHSVANKYDMMNDLMSLGTHRLWKRFTLDRAGLKKGQKVLDLAGGTGDLALKMSQKIGAEGTTVLSDINSSMLNVGRNKLIDKGAMHHIHFVQANAEALPFAENYFDCITIAFGLRNVTDKDKALRSMYQSLKPGGRLLVLEFSKPIVPGLSPLYDLYSFSALPLIGKLVVNDSESYRYLAESIRMHPDQETLKSMMDDAGFELTEYFNLSGGIVALHRGFKL